jgi:hypothetical protein
VVQHAGFSHAGDEEAVLSAADGAHVCGDPEVDSYHVDFGVEGWGEAVEVKKPRPTASSWACSRRILDRVGRGKVEPEIDPRVRDCACGC